MIDTSLKDLKFRIYDEENRELIGEYVIGDLIRVDGDYYEFIGIINDDEEVPLDKNIIYLRESDNKYYKKKAISLDILEKLMSSNLKINKILSPNDPTSSDRIDCIITDKDNALAVLIKKYFKEMEITKSEFKALFKDKPSEVSNTMKKIEDGSLSWNRFIDILQRLGVNFTLYLQTDQYELQRKENNTFYIGKRNIKSYYYSIYTDGGYNHQTNEASYAFTIYRKCEDEDTDSLVSTESGLLTDVKTGDGEIAAVIKALEHLVNRFQIAANDKVRFISDSQYIVTAMLKYVNIWKEKGWKRLNSGAEIVHKDYFIKILDLLAKIPVKVEWEWVKSHSGHERNNEVDLMCRRIARTKNLHK